MTAPPIRVESQVTDSSQAPVLADSSIDTEQELQIELKGCSSEGEKPPVRKLRKVIPLLMATIYSGKYGADRPSRKMKGLWDKHPADWPGHVPFLDPNNAQPSRGQQQKPNKQQLDKMYGFLIKKYETRNMEEESKSKDADGGLQGVIRIEDMKAKFGIEVRPDGTLNMDPSRLILDERGHVQGIRQSQSEVEPSKILSTSDMKQSCEETSTSSITPTASLPNTSQIATNTVYTVLPPAVQNFGQQATTPVTAQDSGMILDSNMQYTNTSACTQQEDASYMNQVMAGICPLSIQENQMSSIYPSTSTDNIMLDLLSSADDFMELDWENENLVLSQDRSEANCQDTTFNEGATKGPSDDVLQDAMDMIGIPSQAQDMPLSIPESQPLGQTLSENVSSWIGNTFPTMSPSAMPFSPNCTEPPLETDTLSPMTVGKEVSSLSPGIKLPYTESESLNSSVEESAGSPCSDANDQFNFEQGLPPAINSGISALPSQTSLNTSQEQTPSLTQARVTTSFESQTPQTHADVQVQVMPNSIQGQARMQIPVCDTGVNTQVIQSNMQDQLTRFGVQEYQAQFSQVPLVQGSVLSVSPVSPGMQQVKNTTQSLPPASAEIHQLNLKTMQVMPTPFGSIQKQSPNSTEPGNGATGDFLVKNFQQACTLPTQPILTSTIYQESPVALETYINEHGQGAVASISSPIQVSQNTVENQDIEPIRRVASQGVQVSLVDTAVTEEKLAPSVCHQTQRNSVVDTSTQADKGELPLSIEEAESTPTSNCWEAMHNYARKPPEAPTWVISSEMPKHASNAPAPWVAPQSKELERKLLKKYSIRRKPKHRRQDMQTYLENVRRVHDMNLNAVDTPPGTEEMGKSVRGEISGAVIPTVVNSFFADDD